MSVTAEKRSRASLPRWTAQAGSHLSTEGDLGSAVLHDEIGTLANHREDTDMYLAQARNLNPERSKGDRTWSSYGISGLPDN